MKTLRKLSLVIVVLFYIVAGINHFIVQPLPILQA